MKFGLIDRVTENKNISFSANEFLIVNKGETTVTIGVLPLLPEGSIQAGFSSEKIEFSESIKFERGTGDLLIIGVR